MLYLDKTFFLVCASLSVMNRNTHLLSSPRKSQAAAFLRKEFVSESGCDQIAILLGVRLAFDLFV